SVPYLNNGFYYYYRYEGEKEYPIYCRMKGSLHAREEILLDENELAKGHSYYQISGYKVSPDNKTLAFAFDTVSRRIYTIRFINLETGEFLPDQISNTTGNMAWANDNRTLFYSVQDYSLRPYQVLKHDLDSKSDTDVVVYEEKDATFRVFVFKTKSKKYLMIASKSTLSDEYQYLDAGNPDGAFKVFQTREKELEYVADHINNNFIIKTNWNAKNFRLMKTNEIKTGKDYWQEIIPHRKDILLENFELFNQYLVIKERSKGLGQFRVKDWHGKTDYYIDFEEQAYAIYTNNNYEQSGNVLRFIYTSLTTPNSEFDFNMKTKERTLLKQQEVLGEFNKDDYQTERLFALSGGGVEIPITLLYRKGIIKDGNNPLYLYGYGSYGYSIDPVFRSNRLSLIDRGFIYAIAHVRGGEEMGRAWYEDGKLLKKKNTFIDFISCAEYLVHEKYTNPEKMFALGGSAGGLLVGAVVNMRPDLFYGVVAHVPFVDVVTTMLDETIPLTTAEYDEWGNPNDKKYYDYMLSYSPYDNVTEKNYPNMLVTTGLHDSQVQYWEPAKWIAKLRELKTDSNLLLLHTNMDTGHSGASGRFKFHRETAREYSFLLYLLGINE
ncbi:S9 family peptidase, partial [candidate division KSB1 bacterium]